MPHPGWPAAVALAFLAAAGTAAPPTAPPPRLIPANAGVPLPRPPEMDGWVGHLMFTHDGKRLTALVDDDWVSWDLRRPDCPPQRGPVPTSNQLVLSPNGRVGIEARPVGFDEPPRRAFIDPGTGRTVRRFDPPETQYTVPLETPCLFSADGRRFVANRRYLNRDSPVGRDVGLTVWDVKTGKRGPTLPCWGVELTPLAISPDGKAVVVRVQANWLELDCFGVWEPDTGRCRWARPADWELSLLTFTAGGSRIVTQNAPVPVISGPSAGALLRFPRYSGPFHILDAATGKLIRSVKGPALGPHPAAGGGDLVVVAQSARAISPDGRFAAVSGFDNTIYLWDLNTDQERCRFKYSGRVLLLAFSPDGRTLAAAGGDERVRLYAVPEDLLGLKRPAP